MVPGNWIPSEDRDDPVMATEIVAFGPARVCAVMFSSPAIIHPPIALFILPCVGSFGLKPSVFRPAVMSPRNARQFPAGDQMVTFKPAQKAGSGGGDGSGRHA